MKENDRLFEMRFRAEKTVAVIKLMNEMFTTTNKDENMILAIMAASYDSFWEGYSWHHDANGKLIYPIMQEFCEKFYGSDNLENRDKEITEFLVSKGYTLPRHAERFLGEL